MSQLITLELPDTITQQASHIAGQTRQRLEDVLLEWLNYVAAELPIELLPDRQVLALSKAQLPPQQQTHLSKLLACQREGQLTATEKRQLADLMKLYRRGLLRKAEALKVAVQRGLMAPLS